MAAPCSGVLVPRGDGLSDPGYGVLSRLADLGGGQLRQQDLADSMGWDKSHLSHHLTRMQQRGLVERQPSGDAVTVRLTPAGRVVLDQAVPVHAAAVRRHLLSRLTAEQQGSSSAWPGGPPP